MADCLPKTISLKVTIFFLVASALLSFLLQSVVSADTLDWLSNGTKADIALAPPAPPVINHAQQCRSQTIAVDMFMTRVNACVFQAKSFRLAYSSQCLLLYQQCHGDSMIAISVGSDTKFYRVNNLYALFGSSYWHASPDSDTLIFGDGGMIRIYDNVPMSLEPQVTVTGREYSFRPQDIRYFKDSVGNGPMAQKLALSENGEWIAASILNFGVVRVHVPDGKVRMISTDTTNTSYYEFAIANNGNYIAVGGINIAPKIYRVDESCGKESSVFWDDPSDLQVGGPFAPCPSRSLTDMVQNAEGVDHTDDYVQYIRYPAFGNLGDTLTLLERYNSNSERWLKLKAPGYISSRLEYLAMGDSISSGEGDTEVNRVTNSKYYRAGTDIDENRENGQPLEKCHISTRSYPYILANSMNLSLEAPIQWESVACSGATSYDIRVLNEDTYDGQEYRLKGYSKAKEMQMYALDNFVPGRIGQLDFVEKYKPKTVTLTVGANDVGFGDKLTGCVTRLTTCSWAGDDRASLASQIKGQYERLASLYRIIKKDAGEGAKIYALGYPYLMSSESGSHCSVNVGALNLAERKVFIDATKYMNAVIESAARRTGVKYIDISTALVGGRLCDNTALYVNGIAPSDLRQSFHPNNQGHRKIASRVSEVLGGENLLLYSDYPSSPNEAISVPDIPEELGGEVGLNSENRKVTSDTLIKNTKAPVVIDPVTFQPDGFVQFSLHSEPVDLGSIRAASDGSLIGEITIPGDTTPGYHTLILKGRTFSGEPIEITQTVLVIGADPKDRDENGILDEVEVCGPFWTDVLKGEAAEVCKSEARSNTIGIYKPGDTVAIEGSTSNWDNRNMGLIIGGFDDIIHQDQPVPYRVAESIDGRGEDKAADKGISKNRKNVLYPIIITIISIVIVVSCIGLFISRKEKHMTKVQLSNGEDLSTNTARRLVQILAISMFGASLLLTYISESSIGDGLDMGTGRMLFAASAIGAFASCVLGAISIIRSKMIKYRFLWSILVIISLSMVIMTTYSYYLTFLQWGGNY